MFSTTYIERKEMNGKINQYVLGKWQKEYTDDPKGAFYKNQVHGYSAEAGGPDHETAPGQSAAEPVASHDESAP